MQPRISLTNRFSLSDQHRYVQRKTVHYTCDAVPQPDHKTMKNHLTKQIAGSVFALIACQLTATADLSTEFAAEFAASDAPKIIPKVRTGNPGTKAKVFSSYNKKKDVTLFRFTIPRGDKGSKGARGPKGDAGPAGAMGATGATGPVGSIGPIGATGPAGPVGPIGATGPAGPVGAVGPIGPIGPDGPVGPAGASPFTLDGLNAVYTQGNVGIGTSAPERRLHVKFPTGGGLVVETDVGNPLVQLKRSSAGAGAKNWDISNDGSTLSFRAIDDGYTSVLSTPLRLTRTGSGGIGRTPSTNQFEVEGTASKTAAGSWLANSDRRIKTDVAEVSGAEALDKLSAVRAVSFDYTPDYREAHPSLDDRRYLNVIAQEFAQVFPEWVKSSGEFLPNTDPEDPANGILQVDTWPLTIYSAAAIKELNERDRKKDAQIAALEARIAALEKLLR
jgi:hypothetical protein